MLGHVSDRSLSPRRFGIVSEVLNPGYVAPDFGVILPIGRARKGRSVVRLSAANGSWVVSAIVAFACLFVPRTAAAQFTSFSGNPRNILEGNWQSCQDPSSGRYAERIYDHVVNGIPQFEVHLGPKREFAIFTGVQDGHREHDLPDNLLKPYRVLLEGTRAKQRWEIPSLKLAFSVTLAGGSRTDCESWFILLEPIEKTSLALPRPARNAQP
jgi:hypothetical protein